MKILAECVSGATQIHNGKCYFIGIEGDNCKVHNMEASGTAATGNKIHDGDSYVSNIMLPKPGVECSNGLYVTNDCIIYYSLG